MGTRSCIRIWKYFSEILEYFGIEIMACLEEVGPSELNLKDVTEQRDTSKYEISQLK